MASRRFDLTWPGMGWKHRSVPDVNIPCARPAMAVRPDYYDRGWRLRDIYRLVGEEERLDQWFKEEGVIGDYRGGGGHVKSVLSGVWCKRSLKRQVCVGLQQKWLQEGPLQPFILHQTRLLLFWHSCWWDILHYFPAYFLIIKTNWIRTYTLWLLPVLSWHLWWSYFGGFG